MNHFFLLVRVQFSFVSIHAFFYNFVLGKYDGQFEIIVVEKKLADIFVSFVCTIFLQYELFVVAINDFLFLAFYYYLSQDQLWFLFCFFLYKGL